MNEIINGDALIELKKFQNDHFDSMITDPPAGIQFMGKKWDEDKGGRHEWINWLSPILSEAKRTLKPGAHALVWSLPRTSHWTGTALGNAGFEIRDQIFHIFGTGFPKSYNISRGIENKLINGTASWNGLNNSDCRLGYSKLQFEQGYRPKDYGNANDEKPPAFEITTPEAKEWSGYGTALKPAVEIWWLVRKPLSEPNVVQNVLKHRVGGLNIDACRIKTDNENDRFPANLIHDGSDVFPENEARFFYSAKASKSEKNAGCDDLEISRPNNRTVTGMGSFTENKVQPGPNNHPTVKNIELMKYLIKLITPPDGIVLDPFCGSGSTLKAAKILGHSFVGIDIDADYCKIAGLRSQEIEIINNEIVNTGDRIQEMMDMFL